MSRRLVDLWLALRIAGVEILGFIWNIVGRPPSVKADSLGAGWYVFYNFRVFRFEFVLG